MVTQLSSENGLIQQEIRAVGGVYWAQTFLTRSNTWLTSSKFRKLGLFWPKAPDLLWVPRALWGRRSQNAADFLVFLVYTNACFHFTGPNHPKIVVFFLWYLQEYFVVVANVGHWGNLLSMLEMAGRGGGQLGQQKFPFVSS